jgi:hypothetical protein
MRHNICVEVIRESPLQGVGQLTLKGAVNARICLNLN